MSIVSIIVPLYKGKKFIANIVNMISKNAAILEKTDSLYQVEIIFVNDYPEETINLDDVPNAKFRVKIITNEFNMGIHDSRVVGIDNATGEFIFFLDQDDTITDDYLISQLRILKENKNALFVISNGTIEHETYKRPIYENKIMQYFAKDPLAYAYLDNRILSPGQCLIRKDAIPEFWKKNALKRNGADDMLLWLLLLETGNKPEINTSRVYTHVNTGNNTSLDMENMYLSVEEMVFLIRKSIDEICIRRKIVDIIDYRNSYLRGEHCKTNVSLLTKIMVYFIYKLRAIKNGEKR